MNKKTTRGAVAAVAGLGMVAVGLMPAVSASAAPDAADSNDAQISSEVTAQLDENGSADILVSLDGKADLSAAYDMSWEDRGQYVYDTLRAQADKSQAGFLADLDAAGADYTSHWINNTVVVKGADAELVSSVASNADVNKVGLLVAPELIAPVENGPVATTNATTWGLDAIKAPQVWEQYGATGEGIVVGTFDTGADVTHEALVNAYRGTETGSDDYNWFDSSGQSDTPIDHGAEIGVPHGTHVTGTMVGLAGEHQIGVAPGAQFIAATGCCVDGADPFTSFEWFAAPTKVDGTDADPNMRPNIVNNSWGYTGYQESLPADMIAELDEGMQAWEAAGILGVWSAGNANESVDGPDLEPCDTISAPSWLDSAGYVVGATQEDGNITSFSSRGMGQDGEPGVDIAAPGAAVESAVPGNGYEMWDGTSMAAPHVSGAVALLWSQFPDLVGDVEGTRALLDASAVDQADPECGGDNANNPTWGEGYLDLVTLFEAAEAAEPVPAPGVTRVAGEDRYQTADAVSDLFGDDVETVYIASGENYPDAVTGSPAAAQGKFDTAGIMETPEGNAAPVLLSKAGKLTNATEAALTELAPENVVILGGETIIGAEVEDQLAADYNVNRVAGADRYETAANLAAMFDDTDKVYVAAGNDNAFSDALTSSALAGSEDAPVLLTKPDSVPAVTAAALEEIGASEIVVIGGTETINDEVYAELGATGRLGGANKFETAAAISAEYAADVQTVYVASANDYPDALASSSLAGSQDVPVIVVKGTHDASDDKIPAVIKDALKTLSPENVVIVGGTEAVDNSVQEWLENPASWQD